MVWFHLYGNLEQANSQRRKVDQRLPEAGEVRSRDWRVIASWISSGYSDDGRTT